MDHRIIVKKLQILQSMINESQLPIKGWQARTADHLSPGKYTYDASWSKTSTPASFTAGKTVFLRTQVDVPVSAPLKDTYLSFDFQDMEGMIRVDGKSYAGLDANHTRVPVPKKGKFEIEIEFISMPAVMYVPELASKSSVFSGGAIAVVNREIEALCHDVRFAWETTKVISDTRRKPLLEDAIEAALLAVDLTLPRQRLVQEVSNARRIFKNRISGISPDPEAGGIYAVGHTHIDTAWLWPLKETVRKCGRTFSTACRMMERYPDFHFACSQAQLYKYTKDNYPELYTQIKKWVKLGRWETTGAMWVEADCNVTSGESLVRQILHGLDFFEKEFGTRPRGCWLPDVFGYPSSLPEILAGCGIKYFYTYKLHWQARNPFPCHLFHWKGLDGSEVLAHVVNHVWGYNCNMTPDHLFKGWEMYAQKAQYPEVIFPFGYGDGGGGVNEEMMEMCKRAKGQFPGLPALRTGSSEGYFDDVVARKPDLPVWDGELYVETHRGTYTTQSALKKANRASELLLRDAEIFGVLSKMNGRTPRSQALHDAWELVLLHQFHDILPGSSIAMVYADALEDHAKIQTIANEEIGKSLSSLAPAPKSQKSISAIRVFNSLSWTRNDTVMAEVPDTGDEFVATSPDGKSYLAQVLSRKSGTATVVFQGAEIPSVGYRDFLISKATAADKSGITVTANKIETSAFLMTLNKDGAITRLYDKINRREIIAHGTVGNDLQLLQDGPEHEDAWNVHETTDKRRYPFEGKTSITVVETGPVRGMLRVRRTHRKSVIEQDIVIYAGMDRIDFVTRVGWQERQTMLKTAFPLEIRSCRATYEVQFGALERPTHRNTSWDQQKFEVPAQRWADMSESGYGVSLLNDSRYGYDAKGNVLRLTLLRSTTFPDPQADRGKHEFTYSLLPHAGNWVEGETVQRAWELNVPVRARPISVPSSSETDSRCFLSLEGADAVVETLKPALDGRGFILRIYEPCGGRGEVTVKTEIPLKKVLNCNLVEEDANELPLKAGKFQFTIKPFQIRTFRLLN